MPLATVETPETPVAEAPITRVDTGLGTTFERWAVNRLLARLVSELDVGALFEGPDDGMCGIAGLNSLVAGRQGVRVSLLLPSAERAVYAKTVWRITPPTPSRRSSRNGTAGGCRSRTAPSIWPGISTS